MSHYAEIDDNNIVTRVIVAEQPFIASGEVGDPSKWLQTSYNTRGGVHYDPETGKPDGGVPLRKNYAGIGYTYNESIDAFVPPKPFDSWTLDDDTGLWDPPVPPPVGAPSTWNEEEQKWETS